MKNASRAFNLIIGLSLVSAAGAGYLYPPTSAKPVTDDYLGVKVVDPYRWLEDISSPEAQQWMASQTKLARAILDALPGRDTLRARLSALYDLPSTSPPSVFGSRYFFTKREDGQNHAVLYVHDGSYKAAPKAVLDPNAFSADGTVALDWWTPSPDGSLLVYGKSEGGNEISTMHALETLTGKPIGTPIPYTRYSAIAWLADGSGFYYSKYPKPGSVPPGDENYYRHIYYHALGSSNPNDDPLIFGKDRQKEEWMDVAATSDYRYLTLTTSIDWVKNDLYIRPLAAPKVSKEFTPIAVGLDGNFNGDTFGDTLFLQTNYQATRNRIIAVDLKNPSPDHWRDIIPQQPGVIDAFKIVGGKLAVAITTDAVSHLDIYSLEGKLEREIPMPTLGSIGGLNGKPDGDELFFSFESFAYPPTVFRYQVSTGTVEATDTMPVPFDLKQYETRQAFFHSKDGTRVPMFIVAKKGTPLNGRNPTLLTGYGGFGISVTPGFSRSLFVWLDRGGVFASANMRGGGEYGREWHEDGRMGKKQNVFDDFIAAAEFLIAQKYTSPEHLAIEGGSNGGLLMGAALTQRPDLFNAVICAVPLLDMLRYQRFAIARLWIPEYGSSDDPAQFKWLYAYSPYQHVTDGAKYPAVLFMVGEEDSRVTPIHGMKMTARMQAANTSANPILIRIEPKAGHGAGKPVSKVIDSEVDKWAFLFWRLHMNG